MKETSIWIALSRYGCSDMSKRLEVLQHSELILLESGHLEILSAFITNNQGMGTKV